MKTHTITKTLTNPELLKPFLVIRTEQEYDEAVERLNTLVDEVGDNPSHPRYRLIQTLSLLIRTYDQQHRDPLPEVSGVDVLRFLMEAHDLTQSDLPEIGGQSIVSEILSGKRALNTRHIRGLAERFGISPAVFF